MARIFTEDFEGGSPGVAITTANTDFDVVGAGSTFTNSLVSEGSLAANVSVTTSAIRFLQVSSAFPTTRPVLFAALYVRLSSLPPSIMYFASATLDGSSVGTLRINTNGTLTVRDGNFGAYTTPSPLSTGVNYRIEWRLDGPNVQQQVRVFNQHSTTALLDSGQLPFSAGAVGAFATGIPIAATNAGYILDWVALDSSTWVGPAVVGSSTPPTANAGANQTAKEPWSTITLTGTSTTGTSPIVSRLWAQTGGTAVTLAFPTAATTTFEAPGTLAGDTLTFTYTVTDSLGVSATDSMTVAVLAATERAVIGGVEVPMRVRTT